MRSVIFAGLKLLATVSVCQLAGLIGVLTIGDAPNYYRKLKKPSFAPPPAIFGPVWTVLYTMMGIALFLVRRKASGTTERKRATTIFAIQLLLNAAWTPVFFGLKQRGLALGIIGFLLVMIAATVVVFWPISVVAALLLVPYLLWVSFAGTLNFELWRRN